VDEERVDEVGVAAGRTHALRVGAGVVLLPRGWSVGDGGAEPEALLQAAQGIGLRQRVGVLHRDPRSSASA
jgi:hypothetical protein